MSAEGTNTCLSLEVLIKALGMVDVLAVKFHHFVCVNEVIQTDGALVEVFSVSFLVGFLVTLDEFLALVVLLLKVYLRFVVANAHGV